MSRRTFDQRLDWLVRRAERRRRRREIRARFWRRYLAGLFGIRAGSAGSVTPERGEHDAAR